MNILILGASSEIGQALAEAFAKNNRLWLQGRNLHRLETSALQLKSSAEQVILVPGDLLEKKRLDEAIKSPIDLVINVASSTSQLRDSLIEPSKIEEYATIDLVAPLQIIEALAKKNKKKINVIFISSILAHLKSPDRSIYALFKQLQNAFLKQMRQNQTIELLTVDIGCVIKLNSSSLIPRQIALKTFQSYCSGKKNLCVGLSGRLLRYAHKIHPYLPASAIYLQRKLRKRK